MLLPEPPIEIEFRDGIHSVPSHLRHLITVSEIDTTRYTYEEAVELTNDAILKNHLNNAMWKLVGSHFRDFR